MNSTKLVVALTALNVAVCAFTLARTATVCAKPETPKEESQAATAAPPQHAAVCDCGFRSIADMATNLVLKTKAEDRLQIKEATEKANREYKEDLKKGVDENFAKRKRVLALQNAYLTAHRPASDGDDKDKTLRMIGRLLLDCKNP